MLGQWGKAKHVLDCKEKGGLRIQIEGWSLTVCLLSFQLDISGKLYLAPLTTVGPMWAGWVVAVWSLKQSLVPSSLEYSC